MERRGSPGPAADARRHRRRRRERALFQRRSVSAIVFDSALSRIKWPSRTVSRVLCRKQKRGTGGRRFLPVGRTRWGALVAPERLVSSFVARRQQPFLGASNRFARQTRRPRRRRRTRAPCLMRALGEQHST